MNDHLAAMSDDGTVVIPEEVRSLLGLRAGDSVAFAVRPDGSVAIRPAPYPTIDSLAGAAGSLPKPMTWHEMREIAYEERIGAILHEDR
jgi:AbrB family looped-hinge helix DNA binding protein